jgi:hypothetical protein
VKTHGETNHRPGARLSAGSQTVLPTVRFSSATIVEFTTVVNNVLSGDAEGCATPAPDKRFQSET